MKRTVANYVHDRALIFVIYHFHKNFKKTFPKNIYEI